MSELKVATPLRMLVLTRKSRGDDEGTHRDQERICREYRDETLRVADVWAEHKVSGGKGWETRKIGFAIEAVKRGKYAGIMHAWEDRIRVRGLRPRSKSGKRWARRARST